MKMLQNFLKYRLRKNVCEKYLIPKLLIVSNLLKFNRKEVISNVFILLFQKNAATLKVTVIPLCGNVLASL